MERGAGRRPGFEFPDSLRLSRASATLEASGLRARARQVGDTLEIEIDGRSGRVLPLPAPARGSCSLWPFGTTRDAETAGAGATTRESLFAAADQPVVLFMRDGAPLDVVRDPALPFSVTSLALGPDRHALMVHDAQFNAADPAALVAAAVARARRRSASRPVMRANDGTEIFAIAEYDARSGLRRIGPGAISLHETSSSQWACAVLAQHALADGRSADELMRSAGDVSSGAAAALALGACAIWRGTAPQQSALRDAAREWMRGVVTRTYPVDDALTAAALALAPAAAEAMGALDLVTMLRARGTPDAGGALKRLAAEDADSAAGRVLRAMHDVAGIVPDAVRGRVGIRPQGIARRLEIEQITVGDGVLAYRAEVGDEQASFEVEQTRGGTPLTILLEPGVPGRRLRSARVDGTHAELDAVPDESGMRVKVQLVADRPRRLELYYER